MKRKMEFVGIDENGGMVFRDPQVSDDSMWVQNRRVIQHEIETPMRGHDDDGECCRRAALRDPDGGLD